MGYNPNVALLFVFIVAAVLIYYVFRVVGKRRKIEDNAMSRKDIDEVLDQKVRFYNFLSADDKQIFLDRVVYFLNTTKISAEKGAVVDDADKVLVAASATIPLFHFKDWAYENLSEVLIYPDTFSEHFSVEGESRNVLGMVGTGALNHKMILSLGALRAGFQKSPSGNTAIHEFVHLIDKADGEIDGIPEYLIPKELIQPWIDEMEKTIREIKSGHSDLNDYATTNEGEFLAVVSEYFFKKPDLLIEDHPKLYSLLNEIYSQREHKG